MLNKPPEYIPDYENMLKTDQYQNLAGGTFVYG